MPHPQEWAKSSPSRCDAACRPSSGARPAPKYLRMRHAPPPTPMMCTAPLVRPMMCTAPLVRPMMCTAPLVRLYWAWSRDAAATPGGRTPTHCPIWKRASRSCGSRTTPSCTRVRWALALAAPLALALALALAPRVHVRAGRQVTPSRLVRCRLPWSLPPPPHQPPCPRRTPCSAACCLAWTPHWGC